MTTSTIKVKVVRRPHIKLKVLPRLFVKGVIAGTINEIAVANGDGVAGAPTVSLPNALTFTGKNITGGAYSGAIITSSTYEGNFWTAGTGRLTIGAGKTLTANSSLTLAGTDGTTLTFQGTDTYVGRATTDTLTNKTLTSPTINGATLTGTIDHSSLLHFDATNFLQVGTANFGGSTGVPGLWVHNGTLSIETGNANLPPSDQGGIHIGMPTAKDQTASGGYGSIKIFSNNINSPEAYLQGTIALRTDPTASLRRLKIECIEQGTASRNLTLNETGGNVGVGVTTPLGKFHVNEGVNKNLIFDTTGITVSGAVGLSAVNDTFGANIPLELRATQTVFSAGSVAIGNLTPTGYLTLAGGAAAAGNAPIKLTSGTNLTTPEAGAVEWNGTNLFVTQTTGPTRKTVAYAETPLSAALGANVLLNNTASYFDGPSVAQGTTGTWLVTASITVYDSNAAGAQFFVKIWDGTTVIASGAANPTASFQTVTMSLTGMITNPAGNLRVSVRDVSNTTGTMLFNQSGNSKDCTIYAVRIG